MRSTKRRLLKSVKIKLYRLKADFFFPNVSYQLNELSGLFPHQNI